MSLHIEIYKRENEILCDLVDSYWHIHGDNFPGPLFNIPDGHQEIFFDLETKEIQVNISRTHPELLLTGKKVNIFIIRFTPYGLSLLLGMEQGICREDTVSCRLFKIAFSQQPIRNKIFDIERVLMLKYSKKQSPDLITKDIAAKIIQARGNEKLGSLYNSYLLSSRQIETNFRSQTTLTPKTFARIIRLTNIIMTKQQDPSLKLTNLSYEYGYADQSHLIKDFKGFFGIAPYQFFRKKRKQANKLSFHINLTVSEK